MRWRLPGGGQRWPLARFARNLYGVSTVMSALAAALATRYRLERELGTGGMATVPVIRDAQMQIAEFFASDGARIIRPSLGELWQIPVSDPLPEDLGYVP